MLIELYTNEGCSLCENTKRYLDARGFEYVEYKIGRDYTKEQVKEMFPAVKMLPVILVDGKITESSNIMLLNEG